MQISTDLDQEVKLLAERAGIPVDHARDLLKQTGSFEEAVRKLDVQE